MKRTCLSGLSLSDRQAKQGLAMNKQVSLQTAIGSLRDGMMIAIGGWGPRRKPMALVREILRSDLKDLTLVSYGGPEVGMLCAAGKVKKVIYGFVSLDVIPLEPYFRKARETGQIEITELDEGLLKLGLRAGAENVPFAPTRIGLGTDILTYNPELKVISSPYNSAEKLVAMPAIKPDVALIHVSYADWLGNTQTHGRDPYFDSLFARAAGNVIISAERLVDRLDISCPDTSQQSLFDRSLVDAVVSAPFGAHPTTAHDHYGWDMQHLKLYCKSAADENGFDAYLQDFVGADEAAYLTNVGGAEHCSTLPIPRF
ncbi:MULTISPECIES: CoA-transferase [unclassified Pseudovibrio]|uniref:CoA transferase subunit A n=1 Tax=unclassified Pseudovibrio TaxID=2627060 RepID=UPI0007B31299|nr:MULTISPECIES: CoA-transferase [unclassified Pseudovibrio]KZL15746.1 Glutaconate CoA-transferase subunit A [Pseudovibrio sp. Ad26]